jgi:beta-lactamase class A
VAYHLAVLGSAIGWLATHWLRGTALMASLAAASGAAIWTATPVPSAGQLVDAVGRPVAGAVVSVASTFLSPSAQALSDARGRYRVGAQRWPYGPLRLSVHAPGFLPAQTAGGRMVLHRWPRVSGLVSDDAGSPIAGAVVTVELGPGVVSAAMTGLDGRFGALLPAAGGTATVTGTSDEHDHGTVQVPLAVDRVADVQLTLPRQFATLHVESDPAGQAPLVDGQAPPSCPATPCDVTVLAGAHQVAFGGDLFLPWQADLQAVKDQTVDVSAALVRKTGTLTVSAPGPGELAVDGQGVAGSSWSGVVPTGEHSLSFRSGGTWPFVQHVSVAWNQVTQANLAPAPVGTDAASFVNGLSAYLAAQGGGSYGVYLEELGSGATIGVGDTTSLEAASVIKVPEAIYLLHEVDAGQVHLDDQVTLQAADFMGGTGSLYGTAQPGDAYSYGQLLSLLIQQSDNTAWMALRRVLTDASIDAFTSSIGAGDCGQEAGDCSARSAGHMMAQLARGRLLSAGSTQLLLGLLESTIFNDRINWYLGGTTIAHKVGMDGGVRNDCGVVFLSRDPFAICVLTAVDDPDQGVQVIRDIARAAAWHYSH